MCEKRCRRGKICGRGATRARRPRWDRQGGPKEGEGEQRSAFDFDTWSQAAVGELSPWMSASDSSKSSTLAGHEGGFDNPSDALLAAPSELFMREAFDAATMEAPPATRAVANPTRMGDMGRAQ